MFARDIDCIYGRKPPLQGLRCLKVIFKAVASTNSNNNNNKNNKKKQIKT